MEVEIANQPISVLLRLKAIVALKQMKRNEKYPIWCDKDRDGLGFIY